MARLKIPIAAASQMAIQQGRGHHHRDRKFTRKCQHGFGEASPSGSGKDARELRIATAVRTINDHLRGLSGEQVGQIVRFLEPDVLAKLRECSRADSRVSREDRLMDRCESSSIGEGGGAVDSAMEDRETRNDSASSHRSRAFKPEHLPCCTEESSEQIAFQAGIGTPWKLLGRPSGEGAQFKWHPQPPSAVSTEVKADVRRMLSSYARTHGMTLSGPDAGKLALRRSVGDHAYWISFAGGISSVVPLASELLNGN
eukprot:gnl/TRDRNA2_/TRDRNA2_177159_c3_seq11.p1 gnl/TRDRNA2_/TRDRNA2_177159_c3~~gnl/TRDRNA2_/TRDRNA2_177159_c3_seq11.p1  ORF type:complete len:292 (+),score=29.60 gnl/TRDRNA2_/TRDRNA2_177159_c3_seq11:110-877(+)